MNRLWIRKAGMIFLPVVVAVIAAALPVAAAPNDPTYGENEMEVLAHGPVHEALPKLWHLIRNRESSSQKRRLSPSTRFHRIRNLMEMWTGFRVIGDGTMIGTILSGSAVPGVLCRPDASGFRGIGSTQQKVINGLQDIGHLKQTVPPHTYPNPRNQWKWDPM